MPLTSRRFPLLLTFDLDSETMWTSRDPIAAKRPILLSQGAYGWKTGVPRIPELLRRYDIRSTFFVPGLIVEQRPQVIENIVAVGHEIAHHSYSHAWIVNLTHKQEREEMEKGFEAIRRATGKAPRGYRAPGSEISDITLGLMKSHKFGYSSSFVAMHPQLIGQPSRLTVLEGLIKHAMNHPNVWMGCCDEISDTLRPNLAVGTK
jgi:peptidoglycan-N-acetylglucosamine deacetylase